MITFVSKLLVEIGSSVQVPHLPHDAFVVVAYTVSDYHPGVWYDDCNAESLSWHDTVILAVCLRLKFFKVCFLF